ncbi:hypothetical protein E2P81_ATG07510 [Venturia nashicola]|uniref:Uncharacterized protein n=1 Tax=Venturia nashicola TaxID=86259 RepID=A0A4Z1PFG5_9PEZI|nr:hypothetical protein E6O75_ATG07668 [Venturia nashicola]TLD32020.1 hypothetical protein E2P81_ATG07510 [Venturia nashicola]
MSLISLIASQIHPRDLDGMIVTSQSLTYPVHLAMMTANENEYKDPASASNNKYPNDEVSMVGDFRKLKRDLKTLSLLLDFGSKTVIITTR